MGSQTLGLYLKNMTNHMFLIIGSEIDKLCGDGKPPAAHLRHRSNDPDDGLDQDKRRKNQFEREPITGEELLRGYKPHSSAA